MEESPTSVSDLKNLLLHLLGRWSPLPVLLAVNAVLSPLFLLVPATHGADNFFLFFFLFFVTC